MPSLFEAEVVTPTSGTEPQAWAANVVLYTAEGGRSDLTLELTVMDWPGPLYAVELGNLHVL